MNATAQEQQTALTLPERAAVALGETANAAKLRELVAKYADILSVTNADGREQAHRAGMVLLKTRTGIRATGKAARDDATKFSKAVIAMEDELIGIIEPEETRLIAMRDEWDAKIEAEKQAKIRAERERVERIADCIAAIREDETDAIRIDKTAEQTRATLAHAEARTITEEVFQERFAEAVEIHAAVLVSIRAVLVERVAQEQAAAEAEQARQAEIARIAAERAELQAQREAAAERDRIARIEADRIAAEQAAERKRLADAAEALEAAARKQQAEAEAKLAAEQAERDRVAAETKRQLEEQQRQIAAAQKALADEQRCNEDHGTALVMDAEWEADRAEQARVASIVVPDDRAALADAADLAVCADEDVCLTISGEMVEVGQLDGEDGHGIVIKCDDGSFVTIKGMTEGDTRDAAPLLFKRVVLTLAEVEA